MATRLTPAVQRLLDYFAETATPEEILAFKFSEEEQERIFDMLDNAAYGEIEPDERAELLQLAALQEEITLLKLRARKTLAAG